MDKLMQLQELCKDARDARRMTAQDISDRSGVSLSTVNNFFSSASKYPSVNTVGPICRALGVSLDRFYEIGDPDPDTAELKQRIHDLELENVRLATENKLQASMMRSGSRVSFVALAFNALLTVALLGYLFFDASVSDMGLIRGGKPGLGGTILIIFALASAVFLLYFAINSLRAKKLK